MNNHFTYDELVTELRYLASAVAYGWDEDVEESVSLVRKKLGLLRDEEDQRHGLDRIRCFRGRGTGNLYIVYPDADRHWHECHIYDKRGFMAKTRVSECDLAIGGTINWQEV